MAIVCVEYFLNLIKVAGAADERVCDEVDVGTNCPFDESAVLFRKRRKIYVDVGDIYALVPLYYAFVHHPANESPFLPVNDGKVHGAVVYQYVRTHGDVFRHVRIGRVEHSPAACLRRVVNDFQGLAGACDESDGIGHLRESDFGTFGVYEYGDAVRYFPNVVDNHLRPFDGCVSRIYAHYVHSVFIQPANEIDVATIVGDGAYYLGFLFFYHKNYRFPLQI